MLLLVIVAFIATHCYRRLKPKTLLAPLSPKIRTEELFTRIKLTPNFRGEGLGVRGLSGWFFYSRDDRSFRVTESAVSNIFDLFTNSNFQFFY